MSKTAFERLLFPYPWEGMAHLPIFRSHAGHSISLVYLKFLIFSATNSKLLMKVHLSERQFLYRNHAEKV